MGYQCTWAHADPIADLFGAIQLKRSHPAGDSMQADAALRILRGSFEPLIMENDRCAGSHRHAWLTCITAGFTVTLNLGCRCLIDMVVNSFVTPVEQETEDDPGHDYSACFTGC